MILWVSNTLEFKQQWLNIDLNGNRYWINDITTQSGKTIVDNCTYQTASKWAKLYELL